MSRSPSPSPSSARGRPRWRDRLRIPSALRRLSRSLTPSVRSRTPPPAQSAPSAASLTSLDATSPPIIGSSVTLPADSSAISTVVPTDSVAPMIIVRDEPIEDPKTKRWNAAMAECQRRMGVDFLGPETANFRSEKDVMDYIAGRENMEPDSESKGRWRKLQRGLVPLARVSKIFCDPIADTISDSFPPSKIVFAAVGLIISASIAAHEEFEQITDALEEIKVHLQVIEMVAGHRGQLLSDTSVELLVSIIIVLSVITKMRREGYVGRFCDAVKENKPLSDALKVLEQTSSRHKAAIDAGTLEIVANIQASDEMRKIKEWLAYDSVELSQTRRMSTLLNDRAQGTCSWFLTSQTFANFLKGRTKMLSVEGKGEEFVKSELLKLMLSLAGCGKSTIIASAISDLRTSRAHRGFEHVVLAHFFDAANKSNMRDLDSLLSSFLCQLAPHDQQCMDTLARAWKQSVSNGYFKCDEKLNTLVDMLGNRLQVFLIIDALDEAAKNEHAQILDALRRMHSCPNISILVSTRVPLPDENLQHTVVPIDQAKDNTDVRTALDIEFGDGGRLFGIAKAEMVHNELMIKADGNMRWLTLIIEQLRGTVNNPRGVRSLLDKLPRSLEELYTERLPDTSNVLIGDIKLLFAWILYSNVPLTTELLSHVLSFNYDARMPTYDPALLSQYPTSQISGLVDSTFISITEGRVRIAHASVREFLVALSPSSPLYISSDDAVCLMVRTSLAYLLAVVTHIHSTEYDDDLLQLWHRCMFHHEGNHYATLEQDIANILRQIGAACPPEGILSPAFRSAVVQGHEQLVSMLLTNGVDVHTLLNDLHKWSDFTYPPPDPDETALHLAAWHGHSGVAELLLERDAHIAARTKRQDTPLTLAAIQGEEDVVRLLLDKGADIADCDEDGNTSLHQATRWGYLSTVSLLLERGAHIAARTKQQKTPLMMATCDGRVDVVSLLLDKGADIEDGDEDGNTSLHQATRWGYLSTVSLLLERGAHIAARDKQQDTPLIVAARNGQEDVVRLLLDKGADIEDCDGDGYTSLHQAARRGHLSTVSLLLERGACIAARTRWQYTPLTVAACNRQEDVVCVLLDKGADIEDCDEDGYTSLHLAVSMGHLSTVSLLLERGANVKAISNVYRTPLHIAAQFGHIDIIRLLVDHGAALETRDENGWTALYHAVHWSQESAIERLLDLSSDPRTRADDGTTLLDTVGRYRYATKDAERDARIREMLLRAGCTEETGRIPLDNGVQSEGAREGS